MTIAEIMAMAPVIPVLVLDGSHDPAELASTLVVAGLPVIEVTLRSPNALAAIEAMAAVSGAVVGAGTVLNPAQLNDSLAAGAQFIVSPGLTEPLAKATIASGVPFLPGIATATDIMRGLDLGLDRFKFFPAEAAGGIAALRALSAPFAGVRFCPTGGITAASAADWLALDAVACVGGSWIVPKGAGMEAVAKLAGAAAAFKRDGGRSNPNQR
jgi:2-dehydro-3-deoxyphosphogluconate aldolase / (4S)-4-hydroxy-2-oxoglutarate aldolase